MYTKTQYRVLMRPIVLAALISSLMPTASAELKEQVLYSFQGGTDGAVPIGGLVRDKVGNLYGATLNGGSSSCAGPGQCGTVYELSPPTQKGGSWTETILYVFKGSDYGDGAIPEGGVIMDSAGNLYGVTGYGGTGSCVLLGPDGCGTVYELSPPTDPGDPWTETVLYSFEGGSDGYFATGSLVFDKAGNLYGATLFGGGQGTTCDILYSANCGTIFELSAPQTKSGQWTEKVLHSFAGGTDGALPNGSLILDSNDAIYGTTFYGGDVSGSCYVGLEGIGCGTVFRLTPSKDGMWTETMIHVFQDKKDSMWPSTGLTFDPMGYLYGTTISTVFRISPPNSNTHGWSLATIYTFVGNGIDPESSLLIDTMGNLYGTTLNSDRAYYGTVYKLSPPTANGGAWMPTLLYGFTGAPGGAQPAGALVFDKSGSLAGTTTQGGNGLNCSFHGCGTVFTVWP